MLLSHHSKSVKSISKSVKSISKYSRSVHDISPRILNISARVKNDKSTTSLVLDQAQNNTVRLSERSRMEHSRTSIVEHTSIIDYRASISIVEPASVVDHSRASVSGFIGRSAVEPITPSVVGTIIDTKRQGATPKSAHDGHKISMNDCDPSPTKEIEDVDRIVYENDLAFVNDNSSVCIEQSRNLDISKLHTVENLAGEAFLDHIGQHMTRVPTLQFNGIGFSFNET